MKAEDIAEALTEVSEKHIEASRPAKKSGRTRRIIALAAAALLLAAGVFAAVKLLVKLGGEINAKADPTTEPVYNYVKAKALAEAVYPETPGRGSEEWENYHAGIKQYYGAGDGLVDFYKRTAAVFLESDGRQNLAYSPFSVYMTLAMLAETTGSETQAQLLSILGAQDTASLREQAKRLWLSNYRDGEGAVCIPSSSIWLRSDAAAGYNTEVLDLLRDEYFASSFEGRMGSAEYDELLHSWMRKATRGLLDEKIDGIGSKSADVMRIVTALSFNMDWAKDFNASENRKQVFHTPRRDKKVTFMNGRADCYYSGANYTMAARALCDGNYAWFILPNEGVSLAEMISDCAPLEVIISNNGGAGFAEGLDVGISLPMFDFESGADLEDGLKKLGADLVFDPERADFSPLCEASQGLFVSEAKHGVRIIADEAGIKAGAFTSIAYSYFGFHNSDLTFTLDRPFMFVICGEDRTPLFAGLVCDPTVN